MRSIDTPSDVGTLGKKVDYPPIDLRPDEQVAPGVFKGRDGKLYTAHYDGEMVAKLSVPRVGLTHLASRIWRWLSSK